MRFNNGELQTKFDKANLASNTLKIEVQGPPPANMPSLPGRKERLTVCHVDNLILLNLSPCLGRADPTSLYDFVRSQPAPHQALDKIIQAVIGQLKLSQVGVVIDRVELLTSLLGAPETLKLLKSLKYQNQQDASHSSSKDVVYPFFAHVDLSLCPSNFEQKLLKLQNGLFRFEREVPQSQGSNTVFAAKAYTSVVKSGCRFQDELVELQVEVLSGPDG